jgi:hypothetical protein
MEFELFHLFIEDMSNFVERFLERHQLQNFFYI